LSPQINILKRLIQELKNENDFSEIRHRYKISLLIDFALILLGPYFFALIFIYSVDLQVNFLKDVYGVVVVLAIPIYFLLADMKEDKIRDKITPAFFITSWNLIMLTMFDILVSNWVLSLNLPSLLSAYFPVFSSQNFYILFFDLLMTPAYSLYALFTYLIMIRTISRRNVAISKN
jgi:hypothetical protein